MMIATTEVRWFFSGPPPPAIGEWFRGGDLSARQPERTDAYLVLPGCTTAGVKLREGRFEVKMLTEEPVPVEYPGGAGGYVDSWLKWSRHVGGAQLADRLAAVEGEEWVRVRKRRTLRGFSLDRACAEADPREVDARGERPERGCGLELTELAVLEPCETSWWTLGLEGFDDRGDPSRCLDRVARHLFSRMAPPAALGLDASYSYAAWLGSGLWRG